MCAKVEVTGGIAEVTSGNVEIIDMDNLKVEGYSSEKREQKLKDALLKYPNVVLVSGGCAFVEKGDVEIIDYDNEESENSERVSSFVKQNQETFQTPNQG